MEHKRGASFLFAGVVKMNGAVQDITGWSFRSEIRRAASGGVAGDLIALLPVTILNAATAQIQLGSNASTGSWPLGAAVIDMRAESPGGTVVISKTARVDIVYSVTT
jgi:hypothetical protein